MTLLPGNLMRRRIFNWADNARLPEVCRIAAISSNNKFYLAFTDSLPRYLSEMRL
jgi:hypothetical protein